MKLLLPLLPIAVFTAYNVAVSSRATARLRAISPSQERVVVIGCTSGIGRQLALHHAQRCAKLVLFSRREAMLSELHGECLRSYGANEKDKVVYIAGDATRKEDVAHCVELTTSLFGGTDTLIICAGTISVLSFAEMCGLDISGAPGQWTVTHRALQEIRPLSFTRSPTSDYHAPLLITQLFLPSLIASSPSPNIIVVSSMAGKSGAPTRGIYSGSKHALHGFFDSLRVELCQYNVHIGLFCPATVDTDLRGSAVDLAFARDASTDSKAKVHGSTKGKLTAEACAKGSSRHQIGENARSLFRGFIIGPCG